VVFLTHLVFFCKLIRTPPSTTRIDFYKQFCSHIVVSFAHTVVIGLVNTSVYFAVSNTTNFSSPTLGSQPLDPNEETALQYSTLGYPVFRKFY